MSSTKRKALESRIQRRVRARRDSSEELEDLSEVTTLSGLESPAPSDDELDKTHSPGEENESLNEDESSDEESRLELAASLSFGALAKAQETLQRPSKRSAVSDSNTRKNPRENDGWEDNEAAERKAGKKDHREYGRSSKHAPIEVSSKKAVSRKREVVNVAKREYRDPRFEPLSGTVDSSKLSKAYSFLDDYREDEMKSLKEQIKKTKDEFERERLKRELLSMESKKKAQARKSKEQEILDRHRREEKQLVKQGKKPFYLKKTEQKKQFLMEQFSELKGKQLDHVIERKRKKVEGKEKKKMPNARRDIAIG